MSTRTSLMALLAAIFGMQASLCAMACASVPEPAVQTGHSSTLTAHAVAGNAAQEMPCHTASRTPASQPPESHDDCGCEALDPATLNQISDAGHRLSLDAAVSPRSPAPALMVPVRHVAWAPNGALGIPPPDILLLKSTLLI